MSEKKHRGNRKEMRLALAAVEVTKRRSRALKFIEKYGINIGGAIFTGGSIYQLATGALTVSPHQVVSSLAFLVACSFMAVDRKNAGLKLSCPLSAFGHAAALYPGLMNAEPSAIGALFANAALNSVGFFNTSLEKKYKDSSHPLLRQTLGKPHRVFGFGMVLFSYLPAIANGLYHKRRSQAIFYTIFTVAGIILGLSKPKRAEPLPVEAQPVNPRPKKNGAPEP